MTNINWKDELIKILSDEKNFYGSSKKTFEKVIQDKEKLIQIKYNINKESSFLKKIFPLNKNSNSTIIFDITIIYDEKKISSEKTSFEENDYNNKLKKIENVCESLSINIKSYFDNESKLTNRNNIEKIYEKNEIKVTPIMTEIKCSKVLILICRLKKDKYIDVRKNIERKNWNEFNLDFKNMSRSIFAYWYGDTNSIPKSLENDYKESKIDLDFINEDLYYYQVKLKIENKENLIFLLTNKNSREREKGLEIVAKNNLAYQYSDLFIELPNDSSMV